MHEKKCDANEAKPKKRAKGIKITAGRGAAVTRGVQNNGKKRKLGLREPNRVGLLSAGSGWN